MSTDRTINPEVANALERNVSHTASIFHLLSLAKNIQHYEAALTEARGERFNIFSILQVDHYEVRTHSPFLAELLNPRGSHGQGAVFLKHFLDILAITNFDGESARVATEVYIGSLGQLDIQLTDRNNRRFRL
jgi:hypothetical protein